MDELPDWVTFPDDDWTQITPAEAGLDEEGFARFIGGVDVRGASFGGEDHTGDKWGMVLTRGGYLVHTWGDRNYRFQTASVGKAFARALFGLAVEDGLAMPDDPIRGTWTGEGELSHPHKHLDRGHHENLTWSHILGPRDDNKHYGGFAIELGNDWSLGAKAESALSFTLPEWAKWTGDPFYDLYSHIEPGTVGHYSSAGFWRLGQALTALWGRDLKDVLDERIFGRIGIPADRWDWFTGRAIKDNKYFYPAIPDTYTYLDPPYEIGGKAVRSAPGWVIINASDLARFGHLVATQGLWKGERIIGHEWLRGHSGGNRSGLSGESKHYTAMGRVTTEGIDYAHSIAKSSFVPEELFVGPVKVRHAA